MQDIPRLNGDVKHNNDDVVVKQEVNDDPEIKELKEDVNDHPEVKEETRLVMMNFIQMVLRLLR